MRELVCPLKVFIGFASLHFKKGATESNTPKHSTLKMWTLLIIKCFEPIANESLMNISILIGKLGQLFTSDRLKAHLLSGNDIHLCAHFKMNHVDTRFQYSSDIHN